jgi:transcription termination factor Rho
VLLVDERPEEVTDMKRGCQGRGHRLHLRPARRGAHAAWPSWSSRRAKRLVEQGKDVVVILDGITRLARAYNLAAPATAAA